MMKRLLAGLVLTTSTSFGGLTPSSLKSTLLTTEATFGQWELDSGEILELEEFDVLAPGATVVVASSKGETAVDLSGLRLWRGRVVDVADSQVFIGVSSRGVNGFIREGDAARILSDAGGAEAAAWTDAMSMELSSDHFDCEVRTIDGSPLPVHREAKPIERAGIPCRVAQLAIDTDWEYTERIFGGDTSAAAVYATTLAGAISEIFVENVNVRFQVSFLRVWSADEDPYDPNSGTDMLDQFRNEWTSNMTEVPRNIAHILSGRTNLPYGGVAWLSVLCNQDWGYAVSGYLNGFFPYPLEDHHGDNWDLVVMAHELGHNFGTLHTHDGYVPTIDDCGNGDCTGAENGTIMSYCHTCPGGISNIRLGFHERVQTVILGFLDDLEPQCDLTAGGGTAVDDWAMALAGEPVVIDVLLNDASSDCIGDFEPEIVAFDETSAFGGTVVLIPGAGSVLDALEYTPATDFEAVDTFTYEIQTGDVATVTVDISGLRPADDPSEPIPGVAVSYYVLDNPSALPDFNTLNSYFMDVVPQIGFQSTDGAFATSGRSDQVGAVFSGWLEVPVNGLYTLSTESDDGSKLLIGETVVVDNDGLHGMQEISGTIGLEAGKHAIRVEFFERAGGAGLLVRYQGPDLPRQIIPSSNWSHSVGDEPCPEDVNGDGEIDVDDLLEVIGAWGECPGCDADVDGSGDVGVDDVLAILSVWGESC